MAEQHGKALVPQIRFAGFTDPWEQRKLGEVARRVTRKNENRDSDLPLTISAQYGLVDQRTFFNNQVASKDMSGYFLLRKGEFAYNKSTSTDSPWGAIKRLEKYDMGCVSTLYICFELLSGDPDFLVTYYETDRWYKAVQLIAAEGARNHGLLNIAPDDFFETQICIPKRIDEQRQIGAFFDRLDSLITLHQRKYDKLCVLKKSMLDKMFPKGGSLYPEIRFAGFTDPWEQRKLEDYVVVSTAKNVDGRFNKEDVLSVSGEYGIVNQIAFQGRSFAGSSVLNYGIVNTGDIVYTRSPLNSNPYGIIKVNKGIPGIVSTLYAVYRPQDNVHTNFIQVYFEQHERMNNYMHPLVNKGAKNDMKVTAENALKGVVTFPSREEQVIISEFFDRLDSLITLHQRKYCGVVSWMLGVALVRLGSESDGAFGEMKHVLR